LDFSANSLLLRLCWTIQGDEIIVEQFQTFLGAGSMGKGREATQVNQRKDPCWRENKLSLRCLDMNDYDKGRCQAEFENYRSCKGFWNSVSCARKREGLYPLVPEGEEERMAFKREYVRSGKIPSTVPQDSSSSD